MHKTMSNYASHGNASTSKVGNASNEYMHGHYYGGHSNDMCGCGAAESACQFPQPPPKRCYCHPAAFTSLDGRSHHRILTAYGNSRPCPNY